MADKRTFGGVEYNTVDVEYFEKRALRRHARVWSLWALGVGAVISGNFFGWNLGLDAGGFGGLFLAAIVATVMYICICYSIAEMSPALPHTGGAYSFGRSAMGPWVGFLTGLSAKSQLSSVINRCRPYPAYRPLFCSLAIRQWCPKVRYLAVDPQL